MGPSLISHRQDIGAKLRSLITRVLGPQLIKPVMVKLITTTLVLTEVFRAPLLPRLQRLCRAARRSLARRHRHRCRRGRCHCLLRGRGGTHLSVPPGAQQLSGWGGAQQNQGGAIDYGSRTEGT